MLDPGQHLEAPTCTWKPGKERQKKVGASKLGTAPALSAHKSERKRLVNSSSQRKARMDCGHCLAESLTLSQMMELPEDEDYRESDQRYASGAKDLAAMMNMSVDEGSFGQIIANINITLPFSCSLLFCGLAVILRSRR